MSYQCSAWHRSLASVLSTLSRAQEPSTSYQPAFGPRSLAGPTFPNILDQSVPVALQVPLSLSRAQAPDRCYLPPPPLGPGS